MTGEDGSREPEIGSVRFNERNEIEFYDGVHWKPYDMGDGTHGDVDEWTVFRTERGDADEWTVFRTDDTDGPEPR
jgi:hypothetical protein